jgi:hypothetical protein
MDQDKVLGMVRKWDISTKPEYRGFRCAMCQRYMRKAWHVWLNHGGFRLEVHFCSKCFKELNE